ncbi:MAG: ferric reductase-like transmembrane domain-containing protein [Patescibacteria group bacterium]
MADIGEMQRAIKRKQRYQLFLFSVGVFLFWLAQFLFQRLWASVGDAASASIRSFAFAGTTLISAALFSSALFRWVPRWAQYWRYRRYLGVSGFILIFFHVWGALALYFNYDFSVVYFSLNPLENPLVFGSIAFFILFLMAITSTDWAMQKLTPKVWKTLHRFVYIAYISAIFHFLRSAPEGMLNNAAGYLLLTLTAAALFGQVYWFFKTVSKKKFRSLGTFVGFGIIISTLVLVYMIWGR